MFPPLIGIFLSYFKPQILNKEKESRKIKQNALSQIYLDIFAHLKIADAEQDSNILPKSLYPTKH
jgi:hypothetical protein